jgi:hypothetical protein
MPSKRLVRVAAASAPEDFNIWDIAAKGKGQVASGKWQSRAAEIYDLRHTIYTAAEPLTRKS